MLGGCRRGDQGVMSLGEGHGEQWSLVECLERRPRGHVTVERDMGINGAWWSAWRGDQGACYCGEGHGDHLKSVDWKRGRGLADGYLRATNRQSWMYGLKTGGAG
jgi:hypothetical protein